MGLSQLHCLLNTTKGTDKQLIANHQFNAQKTPAWGSGRQSSSPISPFHKDCKMTCPSSYTAYWKEVTLDNRPYALLCSQSRYFKWERFSCECKSEEELILLVHLSRAQICASFSRTMLNKLGLSPRSTSSWPWYFEQVNNFFLRPQFPNLKKEVRISRSPPYWGCWGAQIRKQTWKGFVNSVPYVCNGDFPSLSKYSHLECIWQVCSFLEIQEVWGYLSLYTE